MTERQKLSKRVSELERFLGIKHVNNRELIEKYQRGCDKQLVLIN